MIISRTPYRISFFGGGTDYPPDLRYHVTGALAGFPIIDLSVAESETKIIFSA